MDKFKCDQNDRELRKLTTPRVSLVISSKDSNIIKIHVAVIQIMAVLLLLIIANCLTFVQMNDQLSGPRSELTRPIEGFVGSGIEATSSDRQRKHEALPYWFNFDWFTKKYNKVYRGVESSFRRLIFMAKCLQVFKKRVHFRLGLSPYEAAINKFSDWTAAEYKSMFMKSPPPDIVDQPCSRRLTPIEQEDNVALLSNVPQLEVPVLRETGQQVEQQPAATLETARSTIDEMLREAAKLGANDQVEAILDELKQASPTRERSMKSSGRNGLGASQSAKRSKELSLTEAESKPNESERLNYTLPYEDLQIPIYRAPKFSENVGIVNWSLHECFHEIYDQGKRCSQCYVMASTAMAEFYKCAETAEWKQRKFSKNHVFNCAQNFSDRNYGCNGGSIVDVMNFIAYSGVWTVKEWKDKLKEAEKLQPDLFKYDESFRRCPFDRQTVPLKNWGKIKIDITPKAVWPYQWIDYIKQGPMAVIVSMPEGSDIYNKGVHPGDGCATSQDWHSMLLVGYGRENGQDFWLFRNSWGRDWGEQGHFKLSTKVSHECLHTGVRVIRKPWRPYKDQDGAENDVTYLSLAEASFS